MGKCLASEERRARENKYANVKNVPYFFYFFTFVLDRFAAALLFGRSIC
jgi:hypothetical protein